ncbi:AFL232Wp [Eremothecium gossypii ATCC 10895]|uniref:AFL232Wp n=1 Tax=Eremothecium gossypii (strain ATCC 10895 / CBS 109.51 / FGSC 9923 / NRRL Y-1056) TaxID=284811 RepID=Q755P5_EREGS|nr:AFL232Wp [Eremothecium gossypii ATCC 10895]AAS53142.2 AFL232Wp [Eremothecium gossypii ATCC 10895]
MSFLDLEAHPGERGAGTIAAPAAVQDGEVIGLLTELSTQVQNLRKKVQLLGTARDDHTLRNSIESEDIPRCEQLRDRLQSNPRLTGRDKYVSDLHWLTVELLQLKRNYQKRKLGSPLRSKSGAADGGAAAPPGHAPPHEEPGRNSYVSIQVRSDERTPLLAQQQILRQQEHVPQEELDFHSLIQEVRSQEISNIHTQVQDVNAIFKQLGTLVQEQGKQVDTIDSNINGLTSNLQGANQHLRKAERYQRQRNKCGTLTLCVIAVVTLVVVLAALS